MPPRTSKALQAWTDLNDRQQGTLATIYELDQTAETGRRQDAARGVYDNRPADAWRSIDFAHEPAMRRIFGWTTLQERLMWRGWDNQGNGSTMASLERRGLITRDSRPTQWGRMHTVRLTREGRAAARAGTSLKPGGPRKAALGRRSWEVLALLWQAHQRGEPLRWGYSTTIERALIDKHVPPLARFLPTGGYKITEHGCDFYREHHAAHTAAHPDVHAPHPDGADAEPWPPAADELLAQHRQLYRALLSAWKDARAAQQAAEKEATATPKTPAALPAAVVAQAEARHKLWCETAQQRAILAAEHAEDLRTRAEHAARGYAVAALAGHAAAVAHANPLETMNPPTTDPDTWDEPALLAPAETGIHAIDAEATKLHAAAFGRPLKRRGPAPTRRTRRGNVRITDKPDPEPGAALYALAEHLRGHLLDGALVRRLHQTTQPA